MLCADVFLFWGFRIYHLALFIFGSFAFCTKRNLDFGRTHLLWHLTKMTIDSERSLRQNGALASFGFLHRLSCTIEFTSTCLTSAHDPNDLHCQQLTSRPPDVFEYDSQIWPSRHEIAQRQLIQEPRKQVHTPPLSSIQTPNPLWPADLPPFPEPPKEKRCQNDLHPRYRIQISAYGPKHAAARLPGARNRASSVVPVADLEGGSAALEGCRSPSTGLP